MSDQTWARHANPKSAYTRIGSTTPIFFGLWSPFWIGWWGVVPVALVFIWSWVNPRLFAPPTTTESWATRCVLGERAFIARKDIPIPREHQTVALITFAFSFAFLAVTVFAFISVDFWLAFTAWHAAILSKIWFCDRMALLWDDMKDVTEKYSAWNRAKWSVT